MPTPADSVRQTIADLEAQRAQIDAALVELRAVLVSWGVAEGQPVENGTRRPPVVRPLHPPRPQPKKLPAFERKYDRSAKELIGQVTRDSRSKMLTFGDINKALAAQGFAFKKQTVALYVKQLVTEGKLKRHKAPEGSGFNFTYSWVAQELPFGSGGG